MSPRTKLAADEHAMVGRVTPRSRHLLKKYGLTNDQYCELQRLQGNRCAVCQRLSSDFPRLLSVDHDHSTGEVRGLLCTYCNRYVVGRHTKGKSLGILRAVLDYLDRDYYGWIVPPKKKKRRKRKRK